MTLLHVFQCTRQWAEPLIHKKSLRRIHNLPKLHKKPQQAYKNRHSLFFNRQYALRNISMMVPIFKACTLWWEKQTYELKKVQCSIINGNRYIHGILQQCRYVYLILPRKNHGFLFVYNNPHLSLFILLVRLPPKWPVIDPSRGLPVVFDKP